MMNGQVLKQLKLGDSLSKDKTTKSNLQELLEKKRRRRLAQKAEKRAEQFIESAINAEQQDSGLVSLLMFGHIGEQKQNQNRASTSLIEVRINPFQRGTQGESPKRFGSMSFQASPNMVGVEGLKELSKDLYQKIQEEEKNKKSKRSQLSSLLQK